MLKKGKYRGTLLLKNCLTILGKTFYQDFQADLES
jgi:hypothetical protein